MFRKLLIVFIVFGVLSGTLLAQSNTPTTVNVRLIHLAPDAGALNVRINDESFVNQLTPGSFTRWVTYNTPDLSVVLLDGDDAVLTESSVSSDEWTTLAILPAGDSLTILPIREDHSPIAAGEGRLTVFYGVEDAINADLLVDGMLFAREVTEDTSLTVNLVANVYNMALVNTEDPDETLVTFDGVDLEDGLNLLVAAYGDADNIQTLVAVESAVTLDPTATPQESTPLTGGETLIRASHLSSGTPPIDIYLNGELLTEDSLRFPEVARWVAIPAGTYRVAVTLSGEPLSEAVAGPIDITLEGGRFTNLAVIGALANNSLTLHTFEEEFSMLSPDQTRIGILQAHPGVGSITLELDSGVALVSRLGYPGFFGDNDGFTEVVLDAGIYDMTLIQDDNTRPLFQFRQRRFLGGRNYLIAVISADPPFLLTFSDVQETTQMMNPAP